MANTLNVKVLTSPGEWIPGFTMFVLQGSVVAVDAFVVKNKLKGLPTRFQVTDGEADVDATAPEDPEIVAANKAQLEEDDNEARNTPSSEIYDLDYPGKDDLIRGGILTVAQLQQFIADNGDAWFKKVNGIGPATAAQIVALLDGEAVETDADSEADSYAETETENETETKAPKGRRK